jgi:hypothetical protein
VDLLNGPPYNQGLSPYWNAGVRLSFFLLFTYLLASLEGALERERELNQVLGRLRGLVAEHESARRKDG